MFGTCMSLQRGGQGASSIPKTPHGFLSQPLWLVSGRVGERMSNTVGFEHRRATPLIGRTGGITPFTHL